MNKRSLQHVLIAGGGIAGPVLAVFLRRAGLRVSLFEANDGLQTAGGGVGLAENGMAVLTAAGLVTAAKAKSVAAAEWAFENHKGEVLACLREEAPNESGLLPIMITRQELQRVCVDAANAQGAEVHYGKRVITVDDQKEHSLTLGFEDGTTASGDILIGADGIRSDIRRLVMPGSPEPEYTGMLAPGGFSPYKGTEPLTAQTRERVHFRFGQNGFFGFVHVITNSGPRTMWWSTAASPLPTREEQAQTYLKDRQQRLLKLHEGWAEPVAELILSTESIIDVAIHDVPALPTWWAGRTLLIGDAAHAVAPHSGQGASMALEDAMLLGRIIRDNRVQPAGIIFQEFEEQRRPRTNRVIAVGRKNAQRKERMSAPAYWLQQQAMRYLLPLARRRRESWLLDYRIDW